MTPAQERQEALEAAYESAKGRLKLSKQDFMATYGTWTVRPVKVSGAIVGAVLTGGNQIHACIKPEGFRRWLSKGVLKDTLLALLKENGSAMTSVAKGNEIGHRFVTGLGFKPVAETESAIWYEVKHGN